MEKETTEEWTPTRGPGQDVVAGGVRREKGGGGKR